MNQIRRYAWLVATIHQAGEISHDELSKQWESNVKLSGNKPLNRSTFRQWRKDIRERFRLSIDCRGTREPEYFIKNPQDFDNCPYLDELFEECMNRIKSMDIVNSDTVRHEVIECMFFMQKRLIAPGNEDSWFLYLACNRLFYIMHFMNKAEMAYTLKHLTGWFSEGYKFAIECIVKLALTDLVSADLSMRKLGLSDKELVRLISEHSEKACLMLRFDLDKVVVRKLFFKKANEGDSDYAYHLANYLYQKRRYEKAFGYLHKINNHHYDGFISSYLGLMYFYGRGVIRDLDKAKSYLESLEHSAGAEEIYALGDIYMKHTGNFGKAVELYQNFLIQPYENRQNPFYKKIQEQFTQIRSTFGIPDWIIMTVNIGRNNRRCEFSVELPAFCRILLRWGEPRSSVYIYNSGEERRKMTFRHTYRNPGEYKIDFEVTCIHAIEALEFSRYQKQLLDIRFFTGRGLKKLSIIGQCLKTLSLPPCDYLVGLICRNNSIMALDLSQCPHLTYFDCSSNPIYELKLHKDSSLAKACIRNTKLDRERIAMILRSNRGGFCNALDYSSLDSNDMRLEYYFRCTTWDKIRKYLRTRLNHYYSHNLDECEWAFTKLKEMAKQNNRTPYKKGFLEVVDEYVSEDLIAGHEEFFLEKEPWNVSLATQVRDMYRKEPWMRCEITPPEYYVACCLVNMIRNDKEMKPLKKYYGI